jgi:hypothetical protein
MGLKYSTKVERFTARRGARPGRMTSYRRPFVAIFLSALGGLLVLTEGVALAILGITIGADTTGVLGFSVEGLGIVAILEGTMILLLTGLLFFIPEAHRGLGIGLLTFSLLSLSVGGGFLLGALVGWLGGVAAIVARPSPPPEGEADDDWESDFDDPVVEADRSDARAPPPPPSGSAGPAP